MDFPEELKYSKEHLWVRVEGNRGIIGITDFGQQELGVISAVELPEAGDELEQDDSFGSVEARKTYLPYVSLSRSRFSLVPCTI